MWYVIVAAAGLLLGLGLLIWGLLERSARHKAEMATQKAEANIEVMKNNAQADRHLEASLRSTISQLQNQSDALRIALEGARARLLTCKDPQTVKDWLDTMLKDTVL